ncbi:MFS transporter [Phormidium tenue FACHB-886]|nr:MFS transporter [Phormidium tenue FACHB-886]
MAKETTVEKQALKFVIFIGIVSLCADATYEGGRSISGAYLGFLGASGTAVGLIAGVGELIGFGLRLLTGYLSDKTRQYWKLTTLGYVINTAAIPLLAFTGRWETAAALLLAERTGKAIRTPPRDVLLSHAALRVGGGFGFGLHEALDQIGAVSGPLAVAAILAWQQRYQPGFAVLVIPAVLGLIVLLIIQRIYPNPREFEAKTLQLSGEGLPPQFWVYLAGVMFVALGYADFPLIAFHFQATALTQTNTIPLFYAVAMAVDAIAALILGRLFDRHGITVLVGTFLLSALFAPLAFLGNASLALLGMVLWGIGMGAQESIVKAAIATMVPADRRGSAFGIFYLCYGLAWFLGSALMGMLYDRSLLTLIGFSITAQFIAALVLFQVNRRQRV